MPVIGVGRVKDPIQAERILAEGHADLVGIVRAQIADPEFSRKARENQVDDIRLCLSCNQECVGRMGLNRWLGCIETPATGREKEFGIGTLQRGRDAQAGGGGRRRARRPEGRRRSPPGAAIRLRCWRRRSVWVGRSSGRYASPTVPSSATSSATFCTRSTSSMSTCGRTSPRPRRPCCAERPDAVDRRHRLQSRPGNHSGRGRAGRRRCHRHPFRRGEARANACW